LNACDLLCLQAELLHLEADLKDIIRDNNASGDPEKIELQFDLDALINSATDASKKHLWEKTLEIRAKLKEYSMNSDTEPWHLTFHPRRLS
jgi:hypothetical protein